MIVPAQTGTQSMGENGLFKNSRPSLLSFLQCSAAKLFLLINNMENKIKNKKRRRWYNNITHHFNISSRLAGVCTFQPWHVFPWSLWRAPVHWLDIKVYVKSKWYKTIDRRLETQVWSTDIYVTQHKEFPHSNLSHWRTDGNGKWINAYLYKSISSSHEDRSSRSFLMLPSSIANLMPIRPIEARTSLSAIVKEFRICGRHL